SRYQWALLSFPTRRSSDLGIDGNHRRVDAFPLQGLQQVVAEIVRAHPADQAGLGPQARQAKRGVGGGTAQVLAEAGHLFERLVRSEEHTSELQSRENLVCR